MKKNLLLVLLLTVGANLYAQKHQFGVVAKVGNYNLATRQDIRSMNSNTTYWTNPGNLSVLGIVHRFKLNKRFFLSGELIFRYGRLKYGRNFVYKPSGVEHLNTIDANIETQGISMPIKMEWAPFKKQRTMLVAGLGVSRLVGVVTASNARVQTQVGQIQQDILFEYPARKLGPASFSLELGLVGGIMHQIDPQTCIGVEMTYEPKRETFDNFVAGFFSSDSSFVGYPNAEPIGMMSFTLSIRHFFTPEKKY